MYKLMIVDDEPLVIKAVSHIINKEFAEITITNHTGNGLKSIELAREFKPDIILMDIKLNGLNGLESINEIKDFLPETIIIVISAYDNFSYAQRAIKLNVLDYVLKPVTRTDIIKFIKKAITSIEEKNKDYMEKLRLKEKLSNKKNNNYQFHPPWNLEKKLFQTIKTYNLDQIKITNDKLFTYVKNNSVLSEARIYYQELIAVIIRLIYEFLTDKDVPEKNNFKKYQKKIEQACSFDELYQIFFENINTIVQLNKNIKNNNINPLLLKAKKYIENNYNFDLKLNNIAKQVAISPTYLSKLFKEAFNITIIDYITKMRITKASKLLNDSKLNIKEISKQVGYHDPNYFSKVFKKVTGNSPSDYKG